MILHLTCKFEGILNDNNKILNISLSACHENDLTVLGYKSHTFYPQGFTAIILLAESHLSIHTFPEKNFALVDLFMCGAKSKKQVNNIIDKFAEKLGCEILNKKLITR